MSQEKSMLLLSVHKQVQMSLVEHQLYAAVCPAGAQAANTRLLRGALEG